MLGIRSAWARRALVIVLTGGAIALLAACGQKGPLFVPGVPEGASWPYPKPATAPPTPAPPAPADVPATSENKR